MPAPTTLRIALAIAGLGRVGPGLGIARLRILRILFVLILLLIPGSQLLVYPILWILMPSEQPARYPVDAPYPPATPPR